MLELSHVTKRYEGAVPAALLAIGVQWLFEWAERAVIPAGVRTQERA